MKNKVEALVNLNVNPCKMCMPLGAATAFYGIKRCMTILHGSQGCATYIRRHMATHYNEPVDIASSSLTEQGTVYGGEENLKKGLQNLIELYQPSVIGVATTCLAETIGEDIERIIENYKEENELTKDITIIPVHTAGYGGSQYEGYFKTLYSIVSHVKMNPKKNNKINVITSILSPADTRYLKEVFELFGLDVILLPDLSDNLDSGFKETYERLPESGTDIEEIANMAGARYTIELCNLEQYKSPAQFLYDTYHVPYARINLPVGVRDVDTLYKKLSELAQIEIPSKLVLAKRRYLDAMIDSHKYNAGGRAAIFGEPDFVISATRLCAENGIVPLIVASGSANEAIKSKLEEDVKESNARIFQKEYYIEPDSDFKHIEELAEKLRVNLFIGNSDGRRMEENLNVPLIRRGFPIHDRVGGQRLRMLGYEGSLQLLDEITNALLSMTQNHFRKDLLDSYYQKEGKEQIPIEKVMKNEAGEEKIHTAKKENILLEKTKTHPCFNCAGHKYARMHLPIAPHCNIQCNYCVRKFDCPNESRPGVTTRILTPKEAFEKFKQVKQKMPNLTVVGIAGPGDALANFDEVEKTLQMIHEYDPQITFCLSTNGLRLPEYALRLVELGVSHVTVTMNAIDPKIGAKIYKHIHYMGISMQGEAAAAVLLANQLNGLKILIANGVVCKVNIVTLKGINDLHIPQIVEKVKSMGCYITNIMPMISVKGSTFEKNPVASNKEINEIRKNCGEIMLQMMHCKQCRADAIGTLEDDVSIQYEEKKSTEEKLDKRTYRFAVASKSGMLVDQHFGQVSEWQIYEYKDGKISYLNKRDVEKYCTGEENCLDKEDKIQKIIHTVEDCHAVISMRIGQAPRSQLEEKSIVSIVTYDRIESAILSAISILKEEKEKITV